MKLNKEELDLMTNLAIGKVRVNVRVRNSYGQSFVIESYILPGFDQNHKPTNIHDSYIWLFSGINKEVQGQTVPHGEFVCFDQKGWGFLQNNLFVESIQICDSKEIVYQNPDVEKLVETSKIVLESNGIDVDEKIYPQNEGALSLLGLPIVYKGETYLTEYAYKSNDDEVGLHIHAGKNVGNGSLYVEIPVTPDSPLPVYEEAVKNLDEYPSQPFPVVDMRTRKLLKPYYREFIHVNTGEFENE